MFASIDTQPAMLTAAKSFSPGISRADVKECGQAKTRGASIGPGGVSIYGGSGSLSEQDRKKKADLATSRCSSLGHTKMLARLHGFSPSASPCCCGQEVTCTSPAGWVDPTQGIPLLRLEAAAVEVAAAGAAVAAAEVALAAGLVAATVPAPVSCLLRDSHALHVLSTDAASVRQIGNHRHCMTCHSRLEASSALTILRIPAVHGLSCFLHELTRPHH